MIYQAKIDNGLKGIKSFINTHWKKNHILTVDQRIFDLQHKLKNGLYNFFFYKEDNKILSILGVIYSEDSGKSMWLSVWKNIGQNNEGLFLLENLINKEKDFIGSIGINSRVSKLYKLLGWYIVELDHYFQYRELSPVKNENLFNFSLDIKFNISNKKILPNKDNSYFIKRYKNHPTYTYYFLSLKKFNLTFIGREIIYSKIKVFHVVDYIGDIDGIKLKEIIQDFLNKYNFDLFEIMLYSSIPFTTDLKKKTNEIIPTYFKPFVNQNISIKCAYIKNLELAVKIVLGDSDQDRTS